MPRQKKPTAVELLSRNEGKACGECKFFTDENTDGEGLCIFHIIPLVKYCEDKACVWFQGRGIDND